MLGPRHSISSSISKIARVFSSLTTMSRRSSDEQVRDHDSELDEKTVEGKADREKDPEKGLGPAVDSEPEPKATSKAHAKPDIQAWQTLVGSYVFEDFYNLFDVCAHLEM